MICYEKLEFHTAHLSQKRDYDIRNDVFEDWLILLQDYD